MTTGLSGLRWVVIETGSNQSLVFATNKQRLNVAASRLIWSVGFEWIPDSIELVRRARGARTEWRNDSINQCRGDQLAGLLMDRLG